MVYKATLYQKRFTSYYIGILFLSSDQPPDYITYNKEEYVYQELVRMVDIPYTIPPSCQRSGSGEWVVQSVLCYGSNYHTCRGDILCINFLSPKPPVVGSMTNYKFMCYGHFGTGYIIVTFPTGTETPDTIVYNQKEFKLLQLLNFIQLPLQASNVYQSKTTGKWVAVKVVGDRLYSSVQECIKAIENIPIPKTQEHFLYAYPLLPHNDHPQIWTAEKLNPDEYYSVKRKGIRTQMTLNPTKKRTLIPYTEFPVLRDLESVQIATVLTLDEFFDGVAYTNQRVPKLVTGWLITSFQDEMAGIQELLIHSYKTGLITDEQLEKPYNRLVKTVTLALGTNIQGERTAAVISSRRLAASIIKRITTP